MQPRCIAYITLAGEDRITALTLDGDTGGLKPLADLAIAGGPGPLALSPDGSRMYAALRDSNEMATLVVDGSTGALQHLETVGLHSDPCYISTDRTGGFLLSAYYAAGGIAVHAIDERGAVVGQPVMWRETMPKAHCAMTDPSNRFVFLPHVGESNAILRFAFDQDSGSLDHNGPPAARPPAGDGPRHCCYHPNGKVVYFDNEQGSSVTAYHFDQAGGTLTPFQTVSTLPQGWDGENTCAQIWMTPSGRNLYVSNRGHDSIAVFRVHRENGGLTFLDAQPTLRTPRAFGIDPAGGYMLVAGQETGEAGRVPDRSRVGPAGTPLHAPYRRPGPCGCSLPSFLARAYLTLDIAPPRNSAR